MRKTLFLLVQATILLFSSLYSGHWALQQLSGESGLAEIRDDEVAVVYNNWNDSSVEVDSPGTEVYLPFVERVHVLKRSPSPLTMEGQVRVAKVVVPELRLRTSDGSFIHFGAITVRTALIPGQARQALEDRSGRETPNDDLVEAYVRSLAHDEYGRFTAEELLRGENQSLARARTLEGLGQALAPHGIAAMEFSTPDLRFDQTYEKSLEDRRLAYQEVERLKAEFHQLEAERNQRLAALDKMKLIELNATQLQIREYLAKIEQTGKTRQSAALQYQANRRAAGTNRKYQLDNQALSMETEVALRAEVFRQEVEPLARTGRALVREAWIAGLGKTPMRLQPLPRSVEASRKEHTSTPFAGQ